MGILALGPAALHSDHLAPSLVAVHRLLAVGEAFCGDDSRQLRGALAAAAAEALPQAHAVALQRHASALARDPWCRADVTAAGVSTGPMCSGLQPKHVPCFHLSGRLGPPNLDERVNTEMKPGSAFWMNE